VDVNADAAKMMHVLETINRRALAIVAVIGVLVVVLVVALTQGESPKPSAPVVTRAQAAKPAVETNQRYDTAARTDLRNGLTAEKTYYTDAQRYTRATATLAVIEPSLHWNTGGGVQVSVGDIVNGDKRVVCLQELSPSGSILSIADVAAGPNAGTYYNRATCSTTVTTIVGWKGW
jgi:hypothetical protein